jgi:SAM-dependent methyltransferase
VVLPHVLEFAEDAHQVLREVDRILRPEGRVIVSGLNPLSLWGARQLIPAGIARPFLPRQGQFIGLPRLRDWFRLLSFEIEVGRYGCYRPPCATSAWLERTAFMERAGDRWWPICGAVYLFGAVKRVRGMRLIGPAWKSVKASRAAAAVASPQFDASDRGGAHRSAVTLRTPDT